MHRITRNLSVLLALSVLPTTVWAQGSGPGEVTRATLDNGLRVVIIRDALAPVATIEENYLVGGNETPPGFPGTAHAQEHMTFRGCTGLSADQIAAIYAQLGGDMDADTQQNITQYFVTVPAQDLDVALRAGCRLHGRCAGCRRAVGRRSAARSSRKCREIFPLHTYKLHYAVEPRSVRRHALRAGCARHKGVVR